MPPSSNPPLPQTFKNLKNRILNSLSTPINSYTDASPKGTLDTAILPLINRLNSLEGVVTTSSCAGRVSVFVEGSKGKVKARRAEEVGGEKDWGDGVVEENEDYEGGKGKVRKAVPGGKGLGGRWAYVSHEPVIVISKGDDGVRGGLMGIFGLVPEGGGEVCRCTNDARYVRFAFEPMILHIATASLAHASPIISAAISAGFRESGVQSLKNLTDPNALPMVAVRSAGLAFESIIGVVRDVQHRTNHLENGRFDNKANEITEALVDEEYLDMLVQIANERFKANTERMRRFEESLFRGKHKGDEWEVTKDRRERKRKEGLIKKEESKTDSDGTTVIGDQFDEDMDIGALEDLT